MYPCSGGKPLEKVVINMIFPQQGKDCSWGGDLTCNQREFVQHRKPRQQQVPQVHEFGWDESGSVPRYRYRGGAEFDENGPNLTEDVDFEIGTTLVRIEGPEELQSSGIESNTGGRLEIISLWYRAAVEHTLAKANDGNTD